MKEEICGTCKHCKVCNDGRLCDGVCELDNNFGVFFDEECTIGKYEKYPNREYERPLEYGHWYSVDECMPEEFRELKAPYNNCTWNVVVLKDKEDDCVSINYRYLADEWKWRYGIENGTSIITHWSALPKLEK